MCVFLQNQMAMCTISFRHACNDDASLASFTPACLGCLGANFATRHMPPPIEPCLSDGAVYEAPGPGSCDLDIEIYVSASSEHLPLHVMAQVERYVARAHTYRQDVVAVAVGLLV